MIATVEAIVIMLALVSMVFMIFVAPIWITMRYLGKKRSAKTLANDEHTELQRLAEAEVAMRDRIAALESILDADTPNWRRAAGQDGAHG